MYRILTIIAFLLFSLAASGQFIITTSLPGGGQGDGLHECNKAINGVLNKTLYITSCKPLFNSHISYYFKNGPQEGELAGTAELIGGLGGGRMQLNCDSDIRYTYSLQITIDVSEYCEENGQFTLNLAGQPNNVRPSQNGKVNFGFDISLAICCVDGDVIGNNGKKNIQNDINIIPNPIVDFTLISGLLEGDIIQISNLSGQNIFTESYYSGVNHLELNLLDSPAGVYIIRVTRDGDLIFVEKAIKL